MSDLFDEMWQRYNEFLRRLRRYNAAFIVPEETMTISKVNMSHLNRTSALPTVVFIDSEKGDRQF